MDRWNPFREMLALREAMDRMFDDSFMRSTMSSGRAASFPIDLAETDQGFLLRAALPGVRPEDVQITIHGDTLTIRAESKAQEERKEEQLADPGAAQRAVPAPDLPPRPGQPGSGRGQLQGRHPGADPAQGRAGPPAPDQDQRGAGAAPPGSAAPAPAGAERERDGPDSASGTASTASVSPPTAPETPADKHRVTQSSEESMDASDPPSWTRERT